jgi:NhaP-type Na+/H+ or K+/H+ antiporter
MGAGLGFVMGIVFMIISLMQFDDTKANAKDVALVSVLFGIPFSVLIGLGVGWAWGKFLGPNSL